MFDPNDKVTVEFTAAEWNDVLTTLNGNITSACIDGLITLMRQQQRANYLATKINEQAATQEPAREPEIQRPKPQLVPETILTQPAQPMQPAPPSSGRPHSQSQRANRLQAESETNR